MTTLQWIVASTILAGCGFPRPAEVTSCTPGKFAECQGDATMTCNSAGNGYDTLQCAMGCDPSIGCRLCEPSQTVCTNGTVQTCDASGAVTSSQACALGCFQDQPRCTDIDPSNGLAMYMDMAASTPDLDLSSGGTIYTDTGVVQDGKTPLSVVTFLVPAPTNGAAIRVIVANHVHLDGNVSVTVQGSDLGPALAIVANDNIIIDGTLTFDNTAENDDNRNVFPTAGGVAFMTCIGGFASESVTSNLDYQAASGGGGHATNGGKGGSVIDPNGSGAHGGIGGLAMGNSTLIPLHGGCAGGLLGDVRSFGGGALQLSSRRTITINDNATVNLNAPSSGSGLDPGGYQPQLGGGAGGGLLIEAPSVQLGDATRLLVNGAAGSVFSTEVLTSTTTAASEGNPCAPIPGSLLFCSKAGNGASLQGMATDGGDLSTSGANSGDVFQAGGGGGGLGFIRINTANGSYAKANNVIESGVLTTGTLGTR